MPRGPGSWKTSIPDIPAGTQIGEYVVRRKIDSGGMGTVYYGIHPIIKKKVAIKLIHPHVAQNPENIQRFIQEATVVNAIGDPGIVDIFGFGEYQDGRYYFVMEYLEGERLLEFLKRHGKLGAFAASQLLRSLALSLGAAHAKGVIHRDLKAENVFLVPSNDGHWPPRTKLLDFGLAKLLEPLEGHNVPHTRQGITLGTPYYMSPEQCKGKPVDARSDIYALGVLGYELLTGHLPFIHQDLTEVMHMHIKNPVVLPPSPERPQLLDELILGCMEKNPEDRPHDMQEVVASLEMIFDLRTPLHFQELGNEPQVQATNTPSTSLPPLLDEGSPLATDPPTTPQPLPASNASPLSLAPTAPSSQDSLQLTISHKKSSSVDSVRVETLRVQPKARSETKPISRYWSSFLAGVMVGALVGMGLMYLILR